MSEKLPEFFTTTGADASGSSTGKTSTGNTFLENTRESPKLLPVLVLNFGGVSALQYCTGNFYGSDHLEMRLNSLNRDLFKPFRSHRGLLG